MRFPVACPLAAALLLAAFAQAAPRLRYDWAISADGEVLGGGALADSRGSSSAALLSADAPLPLPYELAGLIADGGALAPRAEAPAAVLAYEGDVLLGGAGLALGGALIR